MNTIDVTTRGWVASDPVQFGDQSNRLTVFRLAVTPRWFDKNAGEWKNNATEWFQVRTRHALGEGVAASIRKGQPVFVVGRLSTTSNTDDNGQVHHHVNIDAAHVGHDLSLGAATFHRTDTTANGDQPANNQPATTEAGW